MRKLLYISIAISLLIVAAALVHYNWRADQLREPLAQIPDSAASEHQTAINTPAASPIAPTPVDRSSAGTAPSVDTQLLSLEKEAQLAEINAMIQRMDEAYAADRARHKAEMAALQHGREDIQRENRERRARIAALEANTSMESDDGDPWDSIDLPPELIKAIKDGYANDETLRHLAENGTDEELHAYLSKTHIGDLLADHIADLVADLDKDADLQ